MEQKLQQYQQKVLKDELSDNNYGKTDEDDVSLEELLEDLEDEDNEEFMARYREQRVQQISDHFKEVKKNVREEGYGLLEKIDDEAKLIKLTTTEKRTVISFTLDSFGKCHYMNEKLAILASRNLTTKFLTINVQSCPFLVQKLNVKVLPFVVGYKDGVEMLRILGFSLLGNDPNGFKTDNLEKLLYANNLIETMTGISGSINVKPIRGLKSNNYIGDDSDGSGLDL